VVRHHDPEKRDCVWLIRYFGRELQTSIVTLERLFYWCRRSYLARRVLGGRLCDVSSWRGGAIHNLSAREILDQYVTFYGWLIMFWADGMLMLVTRPLADGNQPPLIGRCMLPMILIRLAAIGLERNPKAIYECVFHRLEQKMEEVVCWWTSTDFGGGATARPNLVLHCPIHCTHFFPGMSE